MGLCPKGMPPEECQAWNNAQYHAAMGVLQYEQSRGTKYALQPDQMKATTLPLSADSVAKACARSGEVSYTGCAVAFSDGNTLIYLNADRSPAAISGTLVHEAQHVNNNMQPPAGGELCARLMAASDVHDMSPGHHAAATRGANPEPGNTGSVLPSERRDCGI